MDFTLKKYKELLGSLSGYNVTLRHDVDAKPENSLRTAKLEASMNIYGVYYFRVCTMDKEIIRQIASLGHEIGYHYENLTTCNGDVDAAYEDFKDNLKRIREIVPVKSICMHGSPRSPYDSKDIWQKYDYHSLGIESEPYLDTDFSQTFYLTDTGRRWDGYKVSVRDKIPKYQEEWTKAGLVFHSTKDVISGLRNSIIPHDLMITVHPQRWNSSFLAWAKELLLQNAKNIIKRMII